MSDYAFNYSFNITGNASTAAQQITGDVTALNNTVKQATGIWDSFAGKVVAFNQLSQFVEGFSRTVDETLAPGAALNASLADLSAISGETGESLKTIERYARDAAKTFGGSAAQSVESYKLLLSQLSPELAKTPDALKAMGDNIAVLSKTMGGDAKAAAEVLTTAMNQYGVSLADPMEASRKMAQMMNVMAAAGAAASHTNTTQITDRINLIPHKQEPPSTNSRISMVRVYTKLLMVTSYRNAHLSKGNPY